MKHASSRELFAYWNERRGDRKAPERADIEPAAIRKSLGDTFILGSDPPARHAFRLAGTRVCALFGRELREEPFISLWDEADRPTVRELVTDVADETLAVVAGATARTTNDFKADLEWLLLPLRHRGRTHLRMIGVLAPIAVPLWLGAGRIERLKLGSLRHIDTHSTEL